ncbi:MAG TPA: ring-cleaving dioxygenase [Desulfomonilaceae bacterium]|nr:ring-cleaving dioxygenase [Desulfomonilaceae bacterium]
MNSEIIGIHHVTAIAGDPQTNLSFYTEVLGLRLVKRTVNFDDPGTYHLYYGDDAGRPGTLITFFPWPGISKGRRGVGQFAAISFAIPETAFGFWIDRFAARGVSFDRPFSRLDEKVLAFYDPDELKLELVAGVEAESSGRTRSVPLSHGITGLHSVALLEESGRDTAEFLTGALGFRFVREEDGRFRFEVGRGGSGAVIDLIRLPTARRGRIAVGTVHHVAWRVPDADTQILWREKLVRVLPDVTPVIDRTYFRSIYFREPGGALFEIATDPPGFTVDEPMDSLGERLALPPWLEYGRSRIENKLPHLVVPSRHRAA